MNVDDRSNKNPLAVRDGLRQMIVNVVFSLLTTVTINCYLFSCLWHTNTHWLHFQHFSFPGIYDSLLYAVFYMAMNFMFTVAYSLLEKTWAVIYLASLDWIRCTLRRWCDSYVATSN